jgi:hypothetical protein
VIADFPVLKGTNKNSSNDSVFVTPGMINNKAYGRIMSCRMQNPAPAKTKQMTGENVS